MARNAKKLIAAKPAARQTTAVPIHERIIDVFAAGYDAQKICLMLAKRHPDIFLSMHRETAAPVEAWHREVIQQNYAGNKVHAIKVLRERTGLGLKEAKDVVDNLTTAMSKLGYMVSPFGTPGELSSTTRPIYDALVDAAERCK